ncbi:MAG: oxygen-independent coproporphyrinogen III oxidase [Paracoccaceae bacterium]
MTQIDRLRALGLFDARVPRYTSYPTAPVFSTHTGAAFQAACLRALPPDEPVSVYVHIPFCERLCWFCACRTQGTATLAPVEAYLDSLERELALLAAHLPTGVRMARLHWGGGTPTILPPALIRRLAAAIKAVIPPADAFEFSVEIDPMLVDGHKIASLREAGMTRASIGIQDFADEVQQAIGRKQPFEATARVAAMLRAAGVGSLNADLVYGLPHQTPARIADSVDKVLSLRPDRVALFGYAHVPWMAKRQKLIDEAALPGDAERYGLATLAAGMFTQAGYRAIGIDHFALPQDSLARAAETGGLRRNFQGYTDDAAPSLLGLGASSISRFPAGYVQNAAATPAYLAAIAEGRLAGSRGHELSADDHLRARAIEMLLCDFALDLPALRARFGGAAEALLPTLRQIGDDFGDLVTLGAAGLALSPPGRPLARIIAQRLDAHSGIEARYSRAS